LNSTTKEHEDLITSRSCDRIDLISNLIQNIVWETIIYNSEFAEASTDEEVQERQRCIQPFSNALQL
jgi:hypothetical protein